MRWRIRHVVDQEVCQNAAYLMSSIHGVGVQIMRRLMVMFLGIAVAFISATAPFAMPRVRADGCGAHHSNVLGVEFQYHAGWKVREQLPTQTVIAGNEADL